MDYRVKSLIIATLTFLGLLSPLRFPEFFWYILPIISLGSALSVFWVFGERPNLNRFKEDWFAIVFVFLFIASLGVFAYTLPHPLFQALVLGSTGFFIYNIMQVASRIKRGYTPSLLLRNIITIASMLAVFFTVSNLTKWIMSSDLRLERLLAIFLSFVFVFIICEFLFEIQGYDRPLLYSLVISFVVTQITWLSSFWVVAYPQSERAVNLGVPLPAIIASVYFYLFWGISHHRLEGNLTRKILWEYVLIASFFTITLILTAEWLPRGV